MYIYIYIGTYGQVSSIGVGYVNMGCLLAEPHKNFVFETVVYILVPFVIVGGTYGLCRTTINNLFYTIYWTC